LNLLAFSLTGITSFSKVPLRAAAVVGFVISALSVLYGVFAIAVYLTIGHLPRGYTSLIVAISFMGGLELTVLGILGEYLGAVFDEVKRRPLYIVDEVIRPHKSSQGSSMGDRVKAVSEQTGMRRGASRRFQSRGPGRGGR
jgi:polyisoprenyl-phosphate glycosyltransferase